MHNVKKYFTEGLIQFTIFLSLLGVRVDLDSYIAPLLEINVGPSSAYIQTSFHGLRDSWDGYGVHPKCPELDYYFAGRRLLEEVRALGSPRFPTQLDAWLVHRVPDGSEEFGEPSSSTSGGDGTSEGTGDHADDTDLANGDSYSSGGAPVHGPPEEHHTAAQQQHSGPGPLTVTGAREEDDEVKSAPHTQAQGQIDGGDDDDGGGVGRDNVEEPAPLTQLVLSSTLEQEGLLGASMPPSSLSDAEEAPPPAIDWSHFLSLPAPDFDDLDPLVPQRLSDLDPDMSGAISQDVSLRDAMVTGPGPYNLAPPRSVARQQGPLLRLESTNSSHSDSSPGATAGLAALPFAAVCNGTRNATSHNALGGCLDEAVFDQINLLGLEGLDAIDAQLLGNMEGIDPRVLEDLDSDSGLSLENSSRGPASPGSSDVSSSSGSFCDDEGGATGYSSEVDSLPSKGGVSDYDSTWSPLDLSESVWHDHSYASPPSSCLRSPTPSAFPYKAVKQEPPSDDDEDEYDHEDERHEPSRDELRARAMCIPFSAPQIVNMPVEEFLELLEGHGLSSAQVSLLRDIRRRGKNKLAAQNCRKRKLDAIAGLQEEVEALRAHRDRLLRERQQTAKALGVAGQRVERLSRDVLSRLRDDLGRPLAPDRYTLRCGAGGRVAVRPISRRVVVATTTTPSSKTDKRKKEKKP